MVISSEFRLRQNRDDDHREDAPHFTVYLAKCYVGDIFVLENVVDK